MFSIKVTKKVQKYWIISQCLCNTMILFYIFAQKGCRIGLSHRVDHISIYACHPCTKIMLLFYVNPNSSLKTESDAKIFLKVTHPSTSKLTGALELVLIGASHLICLRAWVSLFVGHMP